MIESLSDSTIYNAYYTIAHFLQSDFYGTTPGSLGITPDQLNDHIWDYIMLETPYNAELMQIEEEKLELMRHEFRFWYPVDMRASGKDLVPNHLSYYLFNHVAIWENNPKFWPIGVRANGHILLNNEKVRIKWCNWKIST